MFAALLVALQADPLITLECPGRPLKEVIAKLEPVIGHKVYVSAELAEQPVVLLLRERHWSDLRKDLAWCLRATWKDDSLGRTNEDNRALKEALRAQREADIENYLEGVKRQTANWGKWTDDELRNQVRVGFNPDDENPRTVISQACLQLLMSIGAKTISNCAAGAYFAYPPQKGETAFPASSLPIVRQAVEDMRRQLTYYPAPSKFNPSQAILHCDNGSYTFAIASENGWCFQSCTMGEYVDPPAIKPEGSDKALTLSAGSEEYIALRKSLGGAPLAPSPEMVDAINNPMKVDPVELFTGDLLLAIAKTEEREIVASPSGLWTNRLAARARLPITSQVATGQLMPIAEFDRSEGRLCVRSRPGIELCGSRTKLQEVASSIRQAKTSQEIADALFATSFWPAGQAAELLLPQRMINRSIEAGSATADMRPFLVGPIGTKRVVRMSPDMKNVIQGIFKASPTELHIERKKSEIPNAEAPVGMAPRETYDVSGLQDFSVLPLRAFPNGPPSEIEIEIQAPGQQDETWKPLRLFMGATQDRSLAKRVYYHEYGNMLRDFRAGARKDMPAYFWTYGESGANVKIRFPGGYWLSIGASASAIHPNEKAKPISELPAEFVQQAEEYSKLTISRGTPPPTP